MKGEQLPVSPMEGAITGEELVSLFVICTLYQSKRNQAVQETYLFFFHRASFPYARILRSYRI